MTGESRAEEILAGIDRAAGRRDSALTDKAEADKELGHWLNAAVSCPGVKMKDAYARSGVARGTAWALAKAAKSD